MIEMSMVGTFKDIFPSSVSKDMITSYKIGRGDEEHEPELCIWEQFKAQCFVKYGSKT